MIRVDASVARETREVAFTREGWDESFRHHLKGIQRRVHVFCLYALSYFPPTSDSWLVFTNDTLRGHAVELNVGVHLIIDKGLLRRV